ncbi:MAG: hypothetical protein C4337_10430 [Armatimonadota bacterium]
MALFHAQVVPQQPQQVVRVHDGSPNPATAQPTVQRLPDTQPTQSAGKPGRNDPCPCGSGKKYKKCCYPKYG